MEKMQRISDDEGGAHSGTGSRRPYCPRVASSVLRWGLTALLTAAVMASAAGLSPALPARAQSTPVVSIASTQAGREGGQAVVNLSIAPVPAGLRANGHLVAGNVTLRWNAVPGATAYNVRYAKETCNSNGECAPDDWQTPSSAVTAIGSTTKEASLGGLTTKTLYRIEVQAVIVSPSEWSDFALVFPTDSPPDGGTRVATAPFHGYQTNNEFRYVLCEDTIPTGITMSTQDIKDAVDKWENTVTWDRGGVNIITTQAYNLPADEHCDRGPIPPRGRFEVKFLSDNGIRNACNPFSFRGPGPPACWRSSSWTRLGVGQIEAGSVLLNAGRGVDYWNNSVAGGCMKLHEMVVHEVGHAFGIGTTEYFPRPNFNLHPINTEYAIMSYKNIGQYCEPQVYDIVAVMSLYQSR